jgi:hypothetical protein
MSDATVCPQCRCLLSWDGLKVVCVSPYCLEGK